MPTDADKPTRAEMVRRRRMHQQKRHYQGVAREATTVRPLISRPRRVEGRGVKPLRKWRRYNFLSLGGEALSLPTLGLPEITLSWRLASLTMVILLTAMLARLLTERSMFVTALNLGGSALVPAEEIFAESGMAGEHIFWVDPAEAQRRIAAIPGIASAQVSVEWPANVTVVVVERVPLITLREGDKTWWVDAEGQKFQSRGDLGLLPVENDANQTLAALPREAVQGALQLKQLRPNIEKLYYDLQHGLSYQDGRGWRGYFGAGLDMEQKLAVYERLVDNLAAKGVYPTLISVEDLDAPYYKK